MQEFTRRKFLRFAAGLAGSLSVPTIVANAASFPPPCRSPYEEPGVGPIDVHSHIFNASDLQVERFLSRVFAAELPPLLRAVVEFLGPILQAAGWIAAPDGQKELNKLREFEKRRRLGAAVSEMRSLLDQAQKEERRKQVGSNLYL
jgi:hypothetical protein